MGACYSIQAAGLQGKYTIKNRIGIGSFSVVKRAVRLEDNQEFAVKIVNKSSLDTIELKTVEIEGKILGNISNPHVVRLEERYETPTKIYTVLQLLKGGSLLEHINRSEQFSELNVSGIVGNIASALDYLHKKGIAHRDLKPENLLFENDTDPYSIKLTDFGLASYVSPDKPMHTTCGSPSYIAPEILAGKPYYAAVDMWSLGVILYTMLCGVSPFRAQDAKRLFNTIRSGVVKYPDAIWCSISADAKDLVSKLLVLDPKRRYTAEQVLQHPFIKDCSVVSDEPFDASYAERLNNFWDSWKVTSTFMTKINTQNNIS